MPDLDLPAELLQLIEFPPIEDVLIELLRDQLFGIPVYTLIPEHPPFPFVMARRLGNQVVNWNGDPRFVDHARFSVQAFATDPDGDEKAALISEAIRVILRGHWLAHTTLQGLGSVAKLTMASAPTRVTDWATSTGPVQYADLPTDVWRYETQYNLWFRRQL